MNPLTNEEVLRFIDDLLLSGKAATAQEAERQFLDNHLLEIAELSTQLDDHSFEEHEAVKLLMFHGSRRLEDAL